MMAAPACSGGGSTARRACTTSMLNAARCVTPAWTMRSGLRCRGRAGCWRSSTGVRSSVGRDGQPLAAPDGRQLVFTSDRSGSFDLWWADMQRPDSLRPIEGMRPEGRQAPDWAADSRHLLVVGRDEHGRTVIYEISPRDERLQALPVPAEQPLQALYGATEDQLLVVERDADQRTRLSLFDRSIQPWRRLASIDGVSQARFDRGSGRVLFTRLAAGGLWSVDPALSSASVRQISEDRPSRWRYRTWTVAGSGAVGYLGTSTRCGTTLVRIEAGVEAPERCLDAQRLSAGNGISASADGRDLCLRRRRRCFRRSPGF
ncbi:hypothetical protein G6F59_013424 [Rhizopus arrhizus]|nr:hypothetical protein G6F59_013424 [Rhizopus arrhizus]